MCNSHLTNLNKIYATPKNLNLTTNETLLITNNNSFFFKILVIIFMVAQGPILFTFGDRIPNITILLVMFLGYNLLSKQDFFSNINYD